jgi:HlyD family secretion protein
MRAPRAHASGETQMSNEALFRKASVDRLSSPEQLDQLMHVTSARGWIALAAAGLMLAVGVAWGIVGRIRETVSGPGMLIKTGGVFEVVPTAGGRVVDLSVDVGDIVREGQVVARIAQPDLTDKLQDAKAQLLALRAEHAQLVRFSRHGATLDSTYGAQQHDNVTQSLQSAQRELGLLKDRVTNEEQLVAQGLLTRANLLTTQQQYEATRQKVGDAQAQLTQLAQKQLEDDKTQREALATSEARIAAEEDELASLERQYEASSKVVAPYTGRVLEILATDGNLVKSGDAVLTLDLMGGSVKRLEVVLYVPSVSGKQIRPGMPIQIAPSTVKQEEYGLMLGRVTYVSDFPASARGMQRVLQNDRLVTSLAGKDAPYEVHADLVVDPTTLSQYRWSSSKGPPLRIQSGTMATGNIEIDSKRPVEFVLPVLRRLSGL